jgi:acyl-CoA thioesterase-1
MNRFIAYITPPILLLATSLLLGLSSSAFAANILVFGDSLSAGYGLAHGEEWPQLLQDRLSVEYTKSYRIVNASISGETSSGGLARFSTTFDQYQPSIVILELGANDGLRGQPLIDMHNNLAKIITYSTEHKAQVLLIAMKIPPNYGKRYTLAFEKTYVNLQQQYTITLSDFLLSSLSGKPELIQKDGLHPTSEAQPLLLDTVWKSLKPLLRQGK